MGETLTTTVMRLGEIALDLDRRMLSGPRGDVVLINPLFAVMERLARRPGAVISGSDLISAIYQDPDAEPEHSGVMLRKRVKELRALLAVLDTSQRISIRTEIGFGYSIHLRKS